MIKKILFLSIMPEPNYQVTNFKVGVVKSLFEDQGYGFISGTNRELKSDLFFHYRNLLSKQIKEKSIVIFQAVDSSKHAGKLEAVKVVLLSDVIDFSKLMQLYLKYGITDIFKQICTLSAEEIEKRHPEQFLPDLIEHEFNVADDSIKLMKIRRFIKVLKNQPHIDESLIKKCFRDLLESNPLLVKDVFFDVYKVMRDDSIINSLRIDAVELYNSLSDDQKKLHFGDLTLQERFQIKKIGAVDSSEEFDDLLAVIKVENENAAENWRQIKRDVILASKYIPLLWLNDITSDFPHAELAHHIMEYDVTVCEKFILKMSLDQQIVVCPYKLIADQRSYQYLRTCLVYAAEPAKGLTAFLIAGLKIEPLYYLECVADKFIETGDADDEILKEAIKSASVSSQQRLVAALGWRYALKVFDERLETDQFSTLMKVLEWGGFDKANSEELFGLFKMTEASAFRIWEQGLTDFPPVVMIAKYFLQVEKAVLAEDILNKTKYFNDKILDAALTLCTSADTKLTERSPLRLLKALKQFQPDKYEQARISIFNVSNEWIRVYLWLYNHTEVFSFSGFAPYFATLSAQDQKRFIKKAFYEMKQDVAALSLHEIINLKHSVIGPESARDAGFETGGIDFTVYVVLQALEDLSSKIVTKPEAMYRIIGDQIRSPKELLVLNGFFDKCEGRLSIEIIEEGDDKRYEVKLERNDIPKDVIYCEGRKSVIKGTSTPSVCDKTGREFWWCRNGKCYGSCVKPNSAWQNYSLLDFLEIAGVDFVKEDYEVFLGYVNKVNKFLKHLNCRSCNQILKPATGGKDGNYGFYRVSGFCCHNSECAKQGDHIYLTHCINGFCSGVIDSRDAVKCVKSGDTTENLGWYICNDCLACCTSEAIERRRYVLNTTGQGYSGSHGGHRDKGLICCPKCGTEMNAQGSSPDDYKRVLDWFIKNQKTSNFIQNSGQRKDGKYWFVVKAPSWDGEKLKEFKKKLYKYIAIGFNVPDIRQDKDNYLVAEPINDPQPDTTRILCCPNGDYILEVLSDYDRYFAMSKYHIYVQLPSFRST